ncbi:M1 family metallopeptidase [Christiangramia salexigens]|uniref:Aminopeptidase N n=1 Tax=Christiangramia salexigens TaxID=1913577 RepID=A0A1L3J4H0_9FLAO|nr:M1 family metallopeptidase [Christiangramia salexigens]APG60025.1 aminopeptidase [Christiangramia salexigens]
MKKYLKFLFLLFSVLLFSQEPESNQIEAFDFTKVSGRVKIYPEKARVEGALTYVFEVLKPADTLRIDGRKMDFTDVRFNGDPVKFFSDEKGLYVLGDFKSSKLNQISLNYTVEPDSGMYFINWDKPEIADSEKQVWTQGQGKYTSTWLPSFDDLREKLEFDLGFEFPEGYELISNGRLVKQEKLNDSTTLWQFDMENPMSSYLVAIAAGNYRSEVRTSSSGIPIHLYINPEDSLKFEPTYRNSEQIMDFLEREIGVNYPWKNYRQIPVKDFLYAGMENTGTTIFSASLVTDSTGFKDRNYINVNAHELAHQWFGNLVTAKNGKHHWLHEGFATYYALLAEKEIFGDDYYYWKLFETAEQLQELSDMGKGESLLNPKASSLTFYQKGAWALHMLREKIGNEAFRKGMKEYLELYSFSNSDTDEFLAEMQKASGVDLAQFKSNWLEQSAFKSYAALESLKRSEFIKSYLSIAALRETPLEDKNEVLKKALDFPVNDYIGQEVVHQLAGENSEVAIQLYNKAFNTNNLYVRQAIAISMNEIPSMLKGKFESLLSDSSYLTKEVALYKLWEQFPENRHTYLDQTEGVEGFYNKNIRMLWLTLSLVTPEYRPEHSQEYFEELVSYTEAWRPFELRENAFGYLYQLGAFESESLKNLVKATNHHTYSFRNYSRKLLEELLKSERYRRDLIDLAEKMNENDVSYLRSKISG